MAMNEYYRNSSGKLVLRPLSPNEKAERNRRNANEAAKISSIMPLLSNLYDLPNLISSTQKATTGFFRGPSYDEKRLIEKLKFIDRARKFSEKDIIYTLEEIKRILTSDKIARDRKYDQLRTMFAPIFDALGTSGGRRRKTHCRRRKTKKTRRHH